MSDALIRLDRVEKAFASSAGDAHALRGIDLAIERGDIFGIIGRSGAGKSTLLRCINLLVRPSAGRVFFEGGDLTTLDERELRPVRRRIGMIFQQFNLLASRTVYDNVALPLEIAGASRSEIAAAVRPMLGFVGLEALAARYPAQLSGGQQQRVGIARAIVQRPAVLLCDEATSALDPETTATILELLRDANATFGVTIVIVTHEMAVLKSTAKHVAVMDEGQIVERGPLRDIFLHPKHAVTRSLVGEPSSDDLGSLLGARILSISGGNRPALWRLAFSHGGEPVVASLVKLFGLDVDIVSGTIERIGGAPFGSLVLEVSGEPRALAAGYDHLLSRRVSVEVLGYVERSASAAS